MQLQIPNHGKVPALYPRDIKAGMEIFLDDCSIATVESIVKVDLNWFEITVLTRKNDKLMFRKRYSTIIGLNQ